MSALELVAMMTPAELADAGWMIAERAIEEPDCYDENVGKEMMQYSGIPSRFAKTDLVFTE